MKPARLATWAIRGRIAVLSLILSVAAMAVTADLAVAQGPGRGRGEMGRGPDPAMLADRDVFHYLLEHHDKIKRQVTDRDDGVETLTESDDPAVASKIQEHVAAMHRRVQEGRGLRFWDDLFVALFQDHEKVTMTVENTEHGVRVKATSADPRVARLIQAHAHVVSLFAKHGFEEASKNHPVPTAAPAASAGLVYPIIPQHGGVLPRPGAMEPPRAGLKVVFDATAESKPDEVNKGLDRVARLLNLYGSAGLNATDVKIAIVLHGEATRSALGDAAYKARFQVDQNPNLALIRELQRAGVEVFVCGQALNYKGFPDADVADGIPIAAAALTVVANRQADGYTYIPVH